MSLDDLAGIAKAIGASRVRRADRIQSLWSGYGEIFRVDVEGLPYESAIVKSVKPPRSFEKSESRSHARKCRSYDVELTWYRRFASQCDDSCRVPKLLASETSKNEHTFVLEDLDALGFSTRAHDPNSRQTEACLAWIAAFHARFLRVAADHCLWKCGTYWHLATRPDELAAIDDDALRAAAPILDRRLSDASFQTLVHGDAKPANFCFSQNGTEVAAVDFQYVGGGCGMKDVAYFLADDDLADEIEARHLDFYFARLREAIALRDDVVDIAALEREWRALYVVAKVDFYRFLAGWSKHHWRNQTRAQRITRDLLSTLEK